MNQPKYLAIKDDIKNKIISNVYPLDSKIPSEMDLRDEYSVSRHTIRQAISELVKDGYLYKIHGSGTYVSDRHSKNASKKMKTIGVVTTYLSDYIFPSIIRGIEKELSKHQYSLMLASTQNNVESERENLEKMLEHEVDGLIIEPTKSNLLNPNLNYYLDILEEEIPLLMLHASYDELDTPFITMDDEGAGRIATNHLIELGHEKIAIITKSDDSQGKNRLKGYIDALHTAGMSYENDHVIFFDTEDRHEIPKKINNLVDSDNPPTGIICYNDQIAISTIQQIQCLGLKIPDDISIVSHDDSFLSTSFPGVNLTTIEHPQEEMGKQAAQWIINSIEDPEFDRKPIVFPSELIIRNSTKSLNPTEKVVE